MSSEIIDDIRVSTIEIASDSGLNLSNFNARLKHTGAGTFTLTSTSALDNAISIDLPNGGLDVNVEKTIDFKSLDSTETAITLQALAGGIGITAIRNIQLTSANENINLNTQVGDINLESMNTINLYTQIGDINLESNNSINIASGLSDCGAINIFAPYGGMNTYAQNILNSCGLTAFFPFNKEKTNISPQLSNIMNKISPNKNLVGLQQDKLNANELLCPVGVYSQAADYVMAIITDRSSRPIDNETPGFFLVSVDSATIINAVGASGTPGMTGYINSDLILYSEGHIILDAAGYSGILINTNNSTPIAMGTTESHVTVNGDLTVEGNLTVNGDTVQNNVTVFTSEDPVFYLNNGITNINNTSDIGFIGKRGNYENVGWIWKESQDEWIAIGTDSNGVDNIDNDINDYKPARFGGLNVVSDTSRGPTSTVFNVDVNGKIDINTTTIGGINIGNIYSNSPINIGTSSSNITINSNNYNLFSNSNIGITAVGNLNIGTTGSLNITSVGNQNIFSQSNIGITAVGNLNIGTTGSLNITSVGNQNIFSQSNIGITAVGNLNIGTTGSLNITSVAGANITNTGNSSVALVVNQNGSGQDVAIFKDNGITALIVKDGGNVGINKTNPAYPLDVNGTANATSIYQAGFLLVPTGAMMPYAASIAPNGWLLCDGSAFSRTTYLTLYSLIGTTYGNGDGVNTFNLPNLKGRTIFGVNGSDPSFSLGVTGGSKTATLTTNELPEHTHTGTTNSSGSHTHGITDPGHKHTMTTVNDDFNNSGGSNPSFAADSAGSITWNNVINNNITGITINAGGDHTHSFTTGSAGSSNSFSILNPYITLNYIIKY